MKSNKRKKPSSKSPEPKPLDSWPSAAAAKYWEKVEATGMAYELTPQTLVTTSYSEGAIYAENANKKDLEVLYLALNLIADIRAAIGDAEGKLSVVELVKRCKELHEFRNLMLGR